MGLFDGKKGLILGVANDHSIAWAIAQVIMAEGGECGFTHLPDRPDDERQRNRRRVAMLTDPTPQRQVPGAARRAQRRAHQGSDGQGRERSSARSTSCCTRSPSPRSTT